MLQDTTKDAVQAVQRSMPAGKGREIQPEICDAIWAVSKKHPDQTQTTGTCCRNLCFARLSCAASPSTRRASRLILSMGGKDAQFGMAGSFSVVCTNFHIFGWLWLLFFSVKSFFRQILISRCFISFEISSHFCLLLAVSQSILFTQL